MIWEQSSLTYFMSLIAFDTPWKHQKTYGFLMFPEGIKRDQEHEMRQSFAEPQSNVK